MLDTVSLREEARNPNAAEFLLMNSPQKELFEETLGVKCHEVFTLNNVIDKIKKSLNPRKPDNQFKRGYKYLIFDTYQMP